MKKWFIFSLLIVMFIIVGCGRTTIKTNTTLGKLNYYVPDNFISHQELIGIFYNDDTRKIFVDNDIYIDVIKNSISVPLVNYVDNINKNLSEKDVLFTNVKDIIIEKNILSVFGRENYVINGRVNFAYFISYDGYLYTISIHGPNTKNDEVTKIAKEVLTSLILIK